MGSITDGILLSALLSQFVLRRKNLIGSFQETKQGKISFVTDPLHMGWSRAKFILYFLAGQVVSNGLNIKPFHSTGSPLKHPQCQNSPGASLCAGWSCDWPLARQYRINTVYYNQRRRLGLWKVCLPPARCRRDIEVNEIRNTLPRLFVR